MLLLFLLSIRDCLSRSESGVLLLLLGPAWSGAGVADMLADRVEMIFLSSGVLAPPEAFIHN
jgi:hypothetical protein